MKKQIFILVLVVMALFANFTNSYGQACVAGPLSPNPGVSYPYAVTATGAVGATNKLYQFYITKNPANLTGGVHEVVGTDFSVSALPVGATYDNAANTLATINLTWTVASTTSLLPYYLVVKYSETANGCTTENMKVWQIKPINTFVLAIVPSDATGATVLPANAQQCVANMVSGVVTYNADPLLSRVNYTYGQNTLYYKVTASGVLGDWRPDIQLPALPGAGASGQTYVSARWNTKSDGSGSWKSFVGAAGAAPVAATGYLSANADVATITDAVAGSSILIEVVIDNKNWETLAAQPVQVGIDGYLPSLFTLSDAVSSSDCTPEVAYGKKATNTILARPTVTGTVTPFIVKAP